MQKAYTKILCSSFGLSLLSASVFADVKISNLNDFNFGLYPSVGDLIGNYNICVNSIPKTNYQITFWGDGAGGLFEVSNGVNNLPYNVTFNDASKTTGGRKITSGITLLNQKNASIDLDCPSGLNANINIRFQQADLLAANPGRYIGLLTVTVAPQ